MTAFTEHAERVETRLGGLHIRIVGTGRITVLWPSMFVDSHTWDRLVPMLAGGGIEPRTFVLVDPPGLGRSDPLRRRSGIAEAADAARDLLARLAAGPVDWVGNAFGGHVGFSLATDPTLVRSLVAISSPAEAIPRALRRQVTALTPLLRLAGPVGPVRDAVVGAMLTDASAADPGIRRTVEESLARPTRASLARAVRSFILDRTDVSGQLADIRVPSLFVASDDRGDWSPEDAARSAARTPGAQVAVIRGARTLVPLEQPRALADRILAFWADTAPQI